MCGYGNEMRKVVIERILRIEGLRKIRVGSQGGSCRREVGDR